MKIGVWRHTGEKWSRQSEELPLHRVLDLAIRFAGPNSISRRLIDEKLYEAEKPVIDRVGLQ